MVEKRKAYEMLDSSETSHTLPQDGVIEPYQYRAPVAELTLDQLPTAIPSLSQEQQDADLWAIFTLPHKPTGDPAFEAWWKARSPTSEELRSWGWRGKRMNKFGSKKVARVVKTFNVMGEEAEGLGLVDMSRALAVRELDYIVLMFLQYDNHLYLIPSAEERMRILIERISKVIPPPILPLSASIRSVHSSQSMQPESSSSTSSILVSMAEGPTEAGPMSVLDGYLLPSTFEPPNPVVGYEDAQKTLKRALTNPIKFDHLLGQGLKFGTTGILIFGPPGTGKTLLARSLAQNHSWKFYHLPAGSLSSKYVGDSERLIRTLFAEALRNAPAIVFIDGIDSLTRVRSADKTDAARRCQNELLNQWSQLGPRSKVIILGATNSPWEIDTAFLRLFQEEIHMGLPDVEAVKQMFHIHLKGTRHQVHDQIDELAQYCVEHKFTGSDVAGVFSEVTDLCLEEISEATCFQKVILPKDSKTYYEACAPETVDGIHQSYEDFQDKTLVLPRTVLASEILTVLSTTFSRSDDVLISRHIAWASGQH